MVCLSLFFKARRALTHSCTELKESHTLFYKPFLPLSSPHVLSSRILEIENLIIRKQWYAARLKSGHAIQAGLDGLHYLQTYDRVLIRSIVSTAYLGWAAYGALYILGLHQDPSIGDPSARLPIFIIIKTAINAFSLLSIIVSWVLFALQRSPWTFYLYILFPCYFWNQVLLRAVPRIAQWSWSDLSSIDFGRVIGVGVLVVGSLQAMVVSRSWHYQE